MSVTGRSQSRRVQTAVLEICPGHAGPRRLPVGPCPEGSMACKSRAGKRQVTGLLRRHATPGTQDVPMGQRVLCLKPE